MKTINFFAPAILLCLTLVGQPVLKAETCVDISLEMPNNCPTASFSIINNGVTAGIPVSFANQSTGASSYVWDFGDGSTSIAVNPSHVYSAAGTYTVKLRAMIDGCTVEFIGSQDVVVF